MLTPHVVIGHGRPLGTGGSGDNSKKTGLRHRSWQERASKKASGLAGEALLLAGELT